MVSTAIEAKLAARTRVAGQIDTRLATAVLLIEGFVSVSIQMIVLRQLVPIVGYSIGTTSIVITSFLGALALGYRSGGRVGKDVVAKLQRNLIFAALLSAIVLSHGFIERLFGFYFAHFDGALFAVACYSVLCLGPIVYFLAQTVVMLIDFRGGSIATEKAGDTFHLSTIGNVVGGLVTTLVVMYYFGIATAITLDVGLLMLGYLMIARHQPAHAAAKVIGVLFVAITMNVYMERMLFSRTTAYANYYITTETDGNGRLLVVNGQSASRTDHEGIGHAYIEWLERQLFDSKMAMQNVLVLGAGGFSLGQGRTRKNTMKFVDVDEHLAGLADEFLGPGQRSGEFVASDARAYLLRTKERYDAIVLDTYSHRMSMPAHLVTIEFFELLRERLSASGVVYINLIASDNGSKVFTRGFDNSVRSVFARCTTHRIDTIGVTLYNKLYRCVRSPLDNNRAVYSDRNLRADVDASM